MIKKIMIIVTIIMFIIIWSSCTGNADNNSLKCWMTSPSPTTDVPFDTPLELTFSTNIDPSFGTVQLNELSFDADEGWLELNEKVWSLDSYLFDSLQESGKEVTVTVSSFMSADDPNILMEEPKTFTFTYEGSSYTN